MAILKVQTVLGQSVPFYKCGGSLINPSTILTVAHSISIEDKEFLRIRAGDWNLESSYKAKSYQEHKVTEIVHHENFNVATLENDIALLFLEKPFDFTPFVQPICLPSIKIDLTNKPCYSSSWGRHAGQKTNSLRKIKLPIVDHESCEFSLRTKMGQSFTLHSSFLCAGGELFKDTCKGDGGSPLVCKLYDGEPEYYYQVGIVAWGIGCGTEGIPGIYTNVFMFIDWIDKKLKNQIISL